LKNPFSWATKSGHTVAVLLTTPKEMFWGLGADPDAAGEAAPPQALSANTTATSAPPGEAPRRDQLSQDIWFILSSEAEVPKLKAKASYHAPSGEDYNRAP
jgi:hypothetical protein